ncbi:MAG: hypothetical protein JO154_25390 [Chitinophaga sp.]|uniref:contractile injection system tape measure protein n=1 Tax=Chitinophaga sp. TaxID=1869181 RepID=UPI0025C08008|nr:contractile injection system tape measure protein [Chitinophaga sp.]MBV8255954.1 hypothetical protein [Chitinophaga sp.]
MNTHIVNRLEFEISCNDEIQALNLRHNFAATIQELLEEALERVFSKYAGEDTIFYLDKLELDLGTMSTMGFQTSLQQVLEYKLEEALRGKLQPVGGTGNEETFMQHGTPLSMLRFFLLKGRLPWYAGQSVQDLNQLAQQVWKTEATAFANWLLSANIPAAVWQRIEWQFSEEVQQLFVQQLPPLQAMTGRVTAHLHNKFIQLGNKYPISAWQELYDWLNSPSIPMLKPVLAHAMAIIAGNNDRGLMATMVQELQQSGTLPVLTDPAITASTVLTDLVADDKFSFVFSGQNQTTDIMNPYLSNEENNTEKIPIDNAGVVLIAPFLQRFFTVLTLWDEKNKNWTSADAVFKAVCLVHYLSTGETTAPEPQLVLEKALCGLRLEAPFPPAPTLTEADLKEADSLLTAVINYWTAIKNTSIEGLRNSFLMREGLLSRTEQGWKLQVQRKTIDVLVDMIPWGFSTLSFPWSQDLMVIEW